MDKNDLINAVWKRKSVRKYLDESIEKNKTEQLRASISSLNEVSGLTMEFIEESDSFRSIKAIRFKNVNSVIVVKGKRDDIHLYEKSGYYGEQIVLEATHLGLGTCWVAVSFNKKSDSLNVKDDETIVGVISVGYGAEEMIGSNAVPDVPAHRKTKSVYEFLGGNKNSPDWVIAAMKSVQFAPTALNNQRTRFRYSEGTLSTETPLGTLNMIDFGITKFHFELVAGGKFPLGTPSEFKKD